jgi:ribosomal protein S18 acetylase RimI-like enzyme
LIADLGARTFQAAFGADNTPEDMERYLASSFTVDQIRAQLADPISTFLLAYIEDRTLGYAMLRAGRAPDEVKGPEPVELVRIYVETDLVGHGYGSTIMRACLREAAAGGFRTIWLGVWERNTHAIRFYERWGFRQVGTQTFKLGHDLQRDLILLRTLEPPD